MTDDRSLGAGQRLRRRWAKGLTALGAVGLAVFLTWRSTSLSGLPDVGDPLDVDAFCRPIPDETNAFVLYRRAFDRLGREPPVQGIWATANEVERK